MRCVMVLMLYQLGSEVMARPFKDEITKKHDRIIAKVYEQLYRWGFSSSVFEQLIAEAAYKILERSKFTTAGNSEFRSDEDVLSVESINKIYKTWSKNEKKSSFSRIHYRKTSINGTAPKQEHLDSVVCFLMDYMNQEPEKCIFEKPPKCPPEMINNGNWWRFFNGELDGDPVLASKAIKRIETYPKIKISPPNPSRIKK